MHQIPVQILRTKCFLNLLRLWGYFYSSIRIYFKYHLLASFMGCRYFKRLLFVFVLLLLREVINYSLKNCHHLHTMQSVSETIKTQLKCISILANSNHLLLQFFFFFHSLLFSYFKECTQITSVGNFNSWMHSKTNFMDHCFISQFYSGFLRENIIIISIYHPKDHRHFFFQG